MATGGPIDVETLQNWQRIIDINLLGAVRRCRTFTPMLKAQHSGHLVKSLAGWARPPTGYVVLQCDKAGVVALSDSRSFERQPLRIATSVGCPRVPQTNLQLSSSPTG